MSRDPIEPPGMVYFGGSRMTLAAAARLLDLAQGIDGRSQVDRIRQPDRPGLPVEPWPDLCDAWGPDNG